QAEVRPRFDVVHVGHHGLADLLGPVGLRIDRRPDRADHIDVVGPQQFLEALFLAAELVVEGAFGGGGMAHDVGDGGLAVAPLGDRGRQAGQQPSPESVVAGADIGRLHRGRHRVTPLPLPVPSGTVHPSPAVHGSTKDGWSVMTEATIAPDVDHAVRSQKLPPAVPLPKSLQGIAFIASRRWTLTTATRRYGDVFRLNIPVFGRTVVVSDPVLAKQVFSANPDDVGNIQPNLSRVLGPG